MPDDIPLRVSAFLVLLPLALLITGVLIELFGFLWRHSSVRCAARWMILLGTIGSVPAATAVWFGLLTLIPAGTASAAIPASLRGNLLITAAGIGLLLLACLIYLGASDRLRRALHVPLLLVVVLGVTMMIFEAVAMPPGTAGAAGAIAKSPGSQIGSLEIHLLLAAIAAPICILAMGLSFRAAGQPARWRAMVLHPADSNYAAAFVPHATLPDETDEPPPEPRHIPVMRFWALAALLVLAAAGIGMWMLAKSSNLWQARALYHAVVQLDAHHHLAPTRRLAHVLAAAACICLPLVLAFAARFSPRRGFIAAGFGLLLLLAFAAVGWTGFLMSVDTANGPLTHFNRPDSPAVHQAPVRLEKTP